MSVPLQAVCVFTDTEALDCKRLTTGLSGWVQIESNPITAGGIDRTRMSLWERLALLSQDRTASSQRC